MLPGFLVHEASYFGLFDADKVRFFEIFAVKFYAAFVCAARSQQRSRPRQKHPQACAFVPDYPNLNIGLSVKNVAVAQTEFMKE